MEVYKTNIQKTILSFGVCMIGSYFASRPINYVWAIQNQANAWSSVCYALPLAPLSTKGPLVILSVASFGLWANPTDIINFIDVTCIFWVIVVVSLSLLPDAQNKWFVIYFVDMGFVLYMSLAIYYDYSNTVLEYYRMNLIPITGTITVINTFVLGSYYIRYKYFLLGTFMILVGFIFKLNTIYYEFYWGTSIFHTLSAGGIAVLQSVEYKEKALVYKPMSPNL